MFNQIMKAGVALPLLLANVQMASAQVQAQDLAASGQAQKQTVSFRTAPKMVAQNATSSISNSSTSGSEMSPMPEYGNLAMLVAGICMIGFAARRQPIAA